MRYRVVNVFFIPGAEGATIAVRPLDGPFAKAGTVLDLFTTDTALRAHLPDPAIGEWGNAEVIAEATTQLMAQGDPDPVVLPWEAPVATLSAVANPSTTVV